MRYLNSEGKLVGVFSDGIGHLQWVTKLAYSLQSQFIPTKTLSTSSTIQVYPIICTLYERPNIIIRSRNKKTSNTFPKLLQLNIMDYFKQVTSRHVYKFLRVELLQTFLKEGKSYIRIMKMIIYNFMQKVKVSHM
jgi:hypothetical protein